MEATSPVPPAPDQSVPRLPKLLDQLRTAIRVRQCCLALWRPIFGNTTRSPLDILLAA
jgi:hypothetical protein